MNKIFLIALLILFGRTTALVTDNTEPIEVSANTVVIDEREKFSTYTGKASINQGSLTLNAQTIQLFSDQQGVIKVIAKGTYKQPAYYQQNQPNQPRFIEARALEIIYLIKQELLHLMNVLKTDMKERSKDVRRVTFDTNETLVETRIIAYNRTKDLLQRVEGWYNEEQQVNIQLYGCF